MHSKNCRQRLRQVVAVAAWLVALPAAAQTGGPTQADEIQGLIDDIDRRISTIGQANVDSDAALQQLSDNIEEAITKLTSREEENLALRGTTSGLKSEIDLLAEARAGLAADFERLREERASTVSQLEAKVAALADQLAVETQSAADLSGELGRLNAALADAIAARDAALAAREAVVLERETAEATVADQLVVLNRLRTQAAALRQDNQSLQARVADLNDLVDQGKTARADGVAQIAALQAALDGSQGSLADERGRAIDLTEDLRAARSDLLRERDRSLDLSRRLDTALAGLGEAAAATATLEAAVEGAEGRIASLEGELQESRGVLADERAATVAAEDRVSLLSQQLAELTRQLGALNEVLDASEARNRDQKAQIVDLDSRLNQALATRVQELASYRSEFFGRLRQVLGERQDVRVVGDRFVFQSEVLFASGEAELGDDGKTALLGLSSTLADIGVTIPDDLDWVLRVDGHTDERPISTPEFPSNWELSTARALSVVKFMIEAGIDPDRLVAAGFGRYHPIDPRRDEIGFRRNRRIEFKLTQR